MLQNLNTSNILELQFLHNWIEQNKASYQNILIQYIDVLRAIMSIWEDDIYSISNAKKLIQDNKLEYFNASNFDVIILLQAVVKNRHIFENVIFDILSPNTEVISNLQTLLEKGSQIASSNSTKPKDWEAIWDKVIWWHTQLTHSASETVLIHFLVSHYISQYMNVKYWEIYWLKQKDDFLLVMTDILMYSMSGHKEIYKIWSLSKTDWWLWWINEKQLKYFSK